MAGSNFQRVSQPISGAMKWTELDAQPCSIARSLSVIGDRWTLLILRSAPARGASTISSSRSATSHLLANRLTSW